MCVSMFRLWAEGRREDWCPLHYFLPYSFDTRSLPEPEIHFFWGGWQPTGPSDPPVSAFQKARLTGAPGPHHHGLIEWVLGSESGPSSLCIQ